MAQQLCCCLSCGRLLTAVLQFRLLLLLLLVRLQLLQHLPVLLL
jgi:hypothetical protein